MSYLADVKVVGSGETDNPKREEKKITRKTSFQIDGTTNGGTLEQIWVWVGKNKVRAISVWLTDGQDKEIGETTGNVIKFKFEDGEHFTSLSLWKNKEETHLGAIKFKTNHSREFSTFTQNQYLEKDKVSVDVASGICIGIKGCSDKKINCLGFMFLNNIKSTVLTIIEYHNLSNVIPKVNAREIKSMTYHNNTTETQEYKIETSKKITQTSSWSVTGKLEFTFSLQVKAGIPQLAEGTSGYELKLGVEGTYTKDTTEEKTELYTFPVHVPPHKTVDVDITIGQATIVVPFIGRVKVTCHNGGELQFETRGTYKGVTYTGGNVVVTESAQNVDGTS